MPRNVHLRCDLADESALTAQIESLELSRGKYVSGMRFTVTPHSILLETHVAIGSLTIADPKRTERGTMDNKLSLTIDDGG